MQPKDTQSAVKKLYWMKQGYANNSRLAARPLFVYPFFFLRGEGGGMRWGDPSSGTDNLSSQEAAGKQSPADSGDQPRNEYSTQRL